MVVTGPYRDIIMTMAEMFLATYSGPPNSDLDYAFAEYIMGYRWAKAGSYTGSLHFPRKSTD
jgi:hypothetical protein